MSMKHINHFAASLALVAISLGGSAIPAAAADAPQAKTATAKPAVTPKPDDDPVIVEELRMQQSGRWAPQEKPQPLDPKTLSAEEKKLYARVQERWQALVAFDLKKVYSYASPSYRKTYDQAHLNSQYQNKVARTGVEIYEIKFQDDKRTQAKVKVELSFETVLASTGQIFKGSSWETDTWVKVDGQWWYVEPR